MSIFTRFSQRNNGHGLLARAPDGNGNGNGHAARTPNDASATWNVSVVGFGPPSSPRTSSGYARGLCNALRKDNHLRGEFSAKLLRVTDVARGALGMRRQNGRFGVCVRRAWMWSEHGSDLLTSRLDDDIRRCGDCGPFLQVGTLVSIDRALGPHLMRTDMTIAQARRAKYFAVCELSKPRLEEAERVQARVLSTAAHVFAASRWVAESLIHDCGVDAGRVTVLYPSTGLTISSANGQQQQQERVGREILFVGLDWQRKGGPLLFDAFRLVQAKLPDATLRVVGCRPRLRHPGVHVEGPLDKRDPAQARRLEQCFLRASCFCMPSHFEPFGIAFAEAASIGLPAVSIDVGSRREAIVSGLTGVLAKEPTPAGLADALLEVLRDPDYCRQLSDSAKQYARTTFSWEAAVATIGSVVKNLPSGNAAAAAAVVGEGFADDRARAELVVPATECSS